MLAENFPDESGSIIKEVKKIFTAIPPDSDTYLGRVEKFFNDDKQNLIPVMMNIEDLPKKRREAVARANESRGTMPAPTVIIKNMNGNIKNGLSEVLNKYDALLDILSKTEFSDKKGPFKGKELNLIDAIEESMDKPREIVNALSDCEASLRYGEFAAQLGDPDEDAVAYGYMDSKNVCKNFISEYSKLVTDLALGVSLNSLKDRVGDLAKGRKRVNDTNMALQRDANQTRKEAQVQISNNRKFFNDVKELENMSVKGGKNLKECSQKLDSCKADLIMLIREYKEYNSLKGKLKRGKKSVDGVFGEIKKTLGLFKDIIMDIVTVIKFFIKLFGIDRMFTAKYGNIF